MPTIETVIMGAEIFTDPETGQPALDIPQALRRAFKRVSNDYWVAGFPAAALIANGITPSPEGDSAAVQFIDTITIPQGTFRLFAGSATLPAVDALKIALGANRVFTGPEAAGNVTVRTVLKTAVDLSGKRKIRAWVRKSNSSDASFVPPIVVSGHDRFEAATPTGESVDDFEAEDVG